MKETDIEMRNPHTREILKVLKKRMAVICIAASYGSLVCYVVIQAHGRFDDCF